MDEFAARLFNSLYPFLLPRAVLLKKGSLKISKSLWPSFGLVGREVALSAPSSAVPPSPYFVLPPLRVRVARIARHYFGRQRA
jgi:hypothetical protein